MLFSGVHFTLSVLFLLVPATLPCLFFCLVLLVLDNVGHLVFGVPLVSLLRTGHGAIDTIDADTKEDSEGERGREKKRGREEGGGKEQEERRKKRGGERGRAKKRTLEGNVWCGKRWKEASLNFAAQNHSQQKR